MATATKIEWTRAGDEWSEPSGRFLIVGKNRRYELIEAEQGSIMRRAGRQQCMDKAEEMAGGSEAIETPDACPCGSGKVPFNVGDYATGPVWMCPVCSVKKETPTVEEMSKPFIPSAALPDRMEPAAQPKQTVQERIDALVYQYDDFRCLPKGREIAKRAGLNWDEDVTDASINHGLRKMRERGRENARNNNSNPDRVLNVVIEGEAEFDPRVADAAQVSSEKSDNESKGESDMSKTYAVPEKASRAMLVDMGFAGSDAVKAEKLINRLNRLKDADDDVLGAGKNHAKLRDAILKALKSGKNIVLEEKVEANGEAVKPAPKAVKEKKGKAKKAKGEPVELDKFGSPKGSNNSIVNLALTSKPMSFAEIVAKTGLTRGQVRYAHLDTLVKAKHAVKSDEGWALKK